MRAKALLLVLTLAAPLFAGCLNASLAPSAATDAPPLALDPGLVEAPEAKKVARGDGLHLIYTGDLLERPSFDFTFPEAVTRVDATLAVEDPTATITVVMVNKDTGRIRCWPDLYGEYFELRRGATYCSGLTVLDPRPATWTVAPRGYGGGDALPFTLDLRLSTEPLDGSAAAIKVENLAMPRFDQRPTEEFTVTSSADGAPLHVEVTLPDAEGPFPTILVSTPYNTGTRMAGVRAQNSSVNNWVSRGYAVAVADVRGYGKSGGCVEVWGPKEQQDQVDLVEWVAAQPWSDGKVGFYGQSYVGTTPHEAAVHQAPHLTTIATVAGLTDAYFDWHWGGVPNGESVGSPVGYQRLGLLTSTSPWQDPIAHAEQSGNGLCDPTLAARANDPRAVYDDFYAARNFSAKAKDIQVPVWYAHGFYDENVKPSQVLNFFNAIETPKKGLFGPWVHEHPVRADQELQLHAWLDHWLMGRDTGVMDTPTVEVVTNAGTLRTGDAWPPTDARGHALHLDAAAGALAAAPGEAAEASYAATPLHPEKTAYDLRQAEGAGRVTFTGEALAERLYVAGAPHLTVEARLVGATNTHFAAWLYDVAPDGERELVTYGMRNAALKDGYTTYEPVTPGAWATYRVPFQPTEHVVRPGHHLELVVMSADVNDWFLVGPGEPGVVTLRTGGDAASALTLPVLDAPGDAPLPASVQSYSADL